MQRVRVERRREKMDNRTEISRVVHKPLFINMALVVPLSVSIHKREFYILIIRATFFNKRLFVIKKFQEKTLSFLKKIKKRIKFYVIIRKFFEVF